MRLSQAARRDEGEALRETYGRTTCACPSCVEPCTRQPGPLAPGDLERIAVFLNEPLVHVSSLFWASPGSVVANSQTGTVYRVGTITPQLQKGRCVFLGPDDRCAVHPVAPFGCSHFDTHMDWREADERSAALVRAILRSPDYHAERALLPKAESWRPI